MGASRLRPFKSKLPTALEHIDKKGTQSDHLPVPNSAPSDTWASSGLWESLSLPNTIDRRKRAREDLAFNWSQSGTEHFRDLGTQ